MTEKKTDETFADKVNIKQAKLAAYDALFNIRDGEVSGLATTEECILQVLAWLGDTGA